jgi:hypothetical protein
MLAGGGLFVAIRHAEDIMDSRLSFIGMIATNNVAGTFEAGNGDDTQMLPICLLTPQWCCCQCLGTCVYCVPVRGVMCCTIGVSGGGDGGGLYAWIYSISGGVSSSSMSLTTVTATNNTAGAMHWTLL